MPLSVSVLLRVLPAFAVLLATHRAGASDCTDLKENLLTTEGCPNHCDICVLYSPSQHVQCPTDKPSWSCKKASDFVVPNTTGWGCDVNYLCPDSADTQLTISTDTVTAVQSSGFKYPSKPSAVIWVGRENLELPMSVFSTPDHVVDLQFSYYDFSTQLERVEFNPNVNKLSLSHTKLKQVPSSLVRLTLTKLDLSGNSLSTFPQYASLTGLQELDLSSNAFTSIPDAVFSMLSLSRLDLSLCSLQNVVLSTSQLSFLKKIDSLKMTALVTSCPTGYEVQTIDKGNICAEKQNVTTSPLPTTTPPTPAPTKPDDSKTSTWLIVAVVVACVVIVLVLVLRKRRAYIDVELSPGRAAALMGEPVQ